MLLTKVIGTIITPSATISTAASLPTGLSSLYRAKGSTRKTQWESNSTTMLILNNRSEARIFLIVAAASPATMMCEGTYMRLKRPATTMIR